VVVGSVVFTPPWAKEMPVNKSNSGSASFFMILEVSMNYTLNI
jgi:hypothetical protein